jgi:hypothetical protein
MPGIDMNELLQSSQALTFDMLGKGFGAQAARQAIIADRKFDETDLIQAQAAISLGKAGENPRYQPQSTPSAE